MTTTERHASQPTDSAQLVRALRAAVADFGVRSPWPGLVRVVVLGAIAWGSVAIAWRQPLGGGFAIWSAIAAIFYAFWLTCTHEAAHHTLTGWARFDEAIARAISWPSFWPVGTYSVLHRLHHSWNGRNLDDPERTEWTQAEYDRAGLLAQWYVRHQWWIDVLGCGAIGLIAKIFRHGLRQLHVQSRLRSQLASDVAGIAIFQAIGLGWAIASGSIVRYALFWLVFERVVGAIMQCREHIEHYGLWHGSGDIFPDGSCITPVLRQLYATRNLTTTLPVNWLMSGLPYHGVHHAFPEIPAGNLPAAFVSIERVLQECHAPPLPCDPGYWRTSWRLAKGFSTIADLDRLNTSDGR